MATADQLATVATDLLAALVADLPDALGTPVPDRAYVHVGEVAYDIGCGDQLVVAFERAAPGPPGLEIQAPLPGPNVWTSALAVHLVRCVPTMTGQRSNVAPTATVLNAMGIQQMIDAAALRRVIRASYKAGDWGSGCTAMLWGEVIPNGPLGGVCGVVARTLVQV